MSYHTRPLTFVPVSHAYMVGQRDNTPKSWDKSQTITSTISLKSLADKVLKRDKERDKFGTADKNLVPHTFPALGHNRNLISNTHWLELYEERASILEFDAGFSRHEAEARAKREIFYSYVLRTHPDICRVFESLINTTME